MFNFSAYWRVILSTGKTINGYEKRPGLKLNEERPIDWCLDLVSTGDYLNIRELQLVYPGLMRHVSLKITEPGTAFAFLRQVHGVDLTTGRPIDRVESIVVGKVYDKVNGLAQGYIWDRVQGLMGYEDVSVYDFGSWRPGLIPSGRLSLERLGLVL